MTYVTKNDRKHTARTYKDVEAAAIDFRELRKATITRFSWERRMAETLGEFVTRTGAFY